MFFAILGCRVINPPKLLFMKRIFTFFIPGVVAIAALSTALTACNDPKDPNDPKDSKDSKAQDLQEGEDVPFTEYSFEAGIPSEEFFARWINLDGSGEANTLIINSDEKLKEHVEGEHQPVDFDKSTLLVAYGYTATEVLEANVESLTITPTDKFKLQVDLLMLDTTKPDRWVVAILVDKMEEGSIIEVHYQ